MGKQIRGFSVKSKNGEASFIKENIHVGMFYMLCFFLFKFEDWLVKTTWSKQFA